MCHSKEKRVIRNEHPTSLRVPRTERTIYCTLVGDSTSSYLIAQGCMFTGVLLPVVRCLQLDHVSSLNPTVSGWQFFAAPEHHHPCAETLPLFV